MQGKHLYEYAVIRFVPRVEREEFINVGLIMFSKRARFIKAVSYTHLLNWNKQSPRKKKRNSFWLWPICK